jgi:hypothetical protein
VDSGFGYTYLNPQTGHELSAVAGFSYSGMNDALQYHNGIDFHLDWAISQFVSKSVHVGLTGYVYQQVTGDSGAGAKLGDSRATPSASARRSESSSRRSRDIRAI